MWFVYFVVLIFGFANPTLKGSWVVLAEGYWYLQHFWHQFGNSFIVGLPTTFLTLLIGSLASFTVGRMRLRNGWMLTNAALMTYVIPASFLAIPFYRHHADLRAVEPPLRR